MPLLKKTNIKISYFLGLVRDGIFIMQLYVVNGILGNNCYRSLFLFSSNIKLFWIVIQGKRGIQGKELDNF